MYSGVDQNPVGRSSGWLIINANANLGSDPAFYNPNYRLNQRTTVYEPIDLVEGRLQSTCLPHGLETRRNIITT